MHLDGKLVAEEDARISPFDRGVLLGDGVFETMRAYGGRCFALDDHLARLRASCALARLPAPDGLPSIVADVLGANALRDAVVRVTVTRGVGGRGTSPRGAGPPTVLVTGSPIEPRPDLWTRGLRAIVTRRPHLAIAGAKSTSYLGNVLARLDADDRGADEALFADALDHVVEATQANVFAVIGNELVTPHLASGCLAGVTRAHVLRLAPALGLVPRERALRLDELRAADEAFLTGSVLEVGPLVAVDEAPIGAGAPGPKSRAIHEAYRALATSR